MMGEALQIFWADMKWLAVWLSVIAAAFLCVYGLFRAVDTANQYQDRCDKAGGQMTRFYKSSICLLPDGRVVR
jgi:hypothetical protein